MADGRPGARGRVRAVAATAGFVGIVVLTVLVLVHPGPLPLDDALHRLALDHREPVVGLFTVFTHLGTVPVLLPLLLLAGWFAARRTGVWWFVLLAPALLFTGQAARYLLMLAVDRPRPPAQDWVRHASGESFPSGHTTTAALGYGLLLLLLAPSVRKTTRALLSVVLLGLAGLVGVSRIVLGMHWPTDVLGGWSLALLVLPLAAAVLHTAERARPEAAHRRASERVEAWPDPMPADPTSSDPSPSPGGGRPTRRVRS